MLYTEYSGETAGGLWVKGHGIL